MYHQQCYRWICGPGHAIVIDVPSDLEDRCDKKKQIEDIHVEWNGDGWTSDRTDSGVHPPGGDEERKEAVPGNLFSGNRVSTVQRPEETL